VNGNEPLVRHISDTALLAAVYRARETERPDAVFRDPLAGRLAGERGDQIAKSMPFSERATWAWVARTYAYDRAITEQVRSGADVVVNLAAGLDTRPYRMDLPPSLRWFEIDLPDILAYKEEILRNETPRCSLEHIRLDLADVPARRELFARLGAPAKRALVITEGLLVYFDRETVGALARDLAAVPNFHGWLLDIASPGLLEMLRKGMGQQIKAGNAELKFAPSEGPGFFAAYGWTPVEVHSMLRTGARIKRLGPWLRLLSLLPESNREQGSRPWSGVCLLRNSSRPA
jgi:methyltransferase (TIGR00027 family)